MGLEKVYVLLLLLWRKIFSVSLGFVQWLILLLISRVQIVRILFVKVVITIKKSMQLFFTELCILFLSLSLNLSFQGDLIWQRLVCILRRIKFYFFVVFENAFLMNISILTLYLFGIYLWLVWICWIWDTIWLTLRSKWIAFDSLKS